VQRELGIRIQLRDVETFDDITDVTAPAPIMPGDLVATATDVYRVEVILLPPPVLPACRCSQVQSPLLCDVASSRERLE
jgi:hypothetical protein